MWDDYALLWQIVFFFVQKGDPWGKSGPGGAPWRNPNQIGQSFMKSMVCLLSHTVLKVYRRELIIYQIIGLDRQNADENPGRRVMPDCWRPRRTWRIAIQKVHQATHLRNSAATDSFAVLRQLLLRLQSPIQSTSSAACSSIGASWMPQGEHARRCGLKFRLTNQRKPKVPTHEGTPVYDHRRRWISTIIGTPSRPTTSDQSFHNRCDQISQREQKVSWTSLATRWFVAEISSTFLLQMARVWGRQIARWLVSPNVAEAASTWGKHPANNLHHEFFCPNKSPSKMPCLIFHAQQHNAQGCKRHNANASKAQANQSSKTIHTHTKKPNPSQIIEMPNWFIWTNKIIADTQWRWQSIIDYSFWDVRHVLGTSRYFFALIARRLLWLETNIIQNNHLPNVLLSPQAMGRRSSPKPSWIWTIYFTDRERKAKFVSWHDFTKFVDHILFCFVFFFLFNKPISSL